MTTLRCKLGFHRWNYEKLSISRRRKCINCKKKKQDRGYNVYRIEVDKNEFTERFTKEEVE